MTRQPCIRRRLTTGLAQLTLCFLTVPFWSMAPGTPAMASDSATTPPGETQAWPHWGGPSSAFTTPAHELAATWPEAGPPVLWQRDLGDDGYSGIVSDGARLYTMLRREGNETILAVDAATGETAWEHAYPAPLPEGMYLDYGTGPYATPGLAGGRIFSVGVTVKVHALDAASGKVAWTRDLKEELDTPFMPRGHGASPLLFEDLVILTPGGEGHAVIALRQDTGETVWTSQDFRGGYSSPILAELDGEPMVVVAMGPERAGLHPRTGKLLWQLTLRREASSIMSTQLWGEDAILFGSSAYADGSRAIQLTKNEAGEITAEELWYSRKMRVQHGTAVRLGNHVYGSSGDFGPAFLAAVDVRTGELAFRQRGFSKANLLAVGGKILILDEDGTLALGNPSPEGIEILTEAQIFDDRSWTVPTLLGTTLYVRNRGTMKALDLGEQTPKAKVTAVQGGAR